MATTDRRGIDGRRPPRVGNGALERRSTVTNLITTAQFWFFLHMGVGVIWIHAFAGGIAGLVGSRTSRLKEHLRRSSTVALSAIAWVAVVTGTYFVYPGYRAKPPDGLTDLAAYPKYSLLDTPHLGFWHQFGMEWKEHIGWMTPFLATAIAFIVLRYGRRVTADSTVRKSIAGLFVVAAGGALVAAVFGGAINAIAPNDFLDH
jgi:hypothetical protein